MVVKNKVLQDVTNELDGDTYVLQNCLFHVLFPLLTQAWYIIQNTRFINMIKTLSLRQFVSFCGEIVRFRLLYVSIIQYVGCPKSS